MIPVRPKNIFEPVNNLEPFIICDPLTILEPVIIMSFGSFLSTGQEKGEEEKQVEVGGRSRLGLTADIPAPVLQVQTGEE